MTKHEGFTPGPWKCEDGRSIQTSSGSFYLAYHTEKGTGITGFRDFCELDRNAHLIADAPALLAERDMLLALLERSKTRLDPSDENDAYLLAQIRAALAPSKGE